MTVQPPRSGTRLVPEGLQDKDQLWEGAVFRVVPW